MCLLKHVRQNVKNCNPRERAVSTWTHPKPSDLSASYFSELPAFIKSRGWWCAWRRLSYENLRKYTFNKYFWEIISNLGYVIHIKIPLKFYIQMFIWWNLLVVFSFWLFVDWCYIKLFRAEAKSCDVCNLVFGGHSSSDNCVTSAPRALHRQWLEWHF